MSLFAQLLRTFRLRARLLARTDCNRRGKRRLKLWSIRSEVSQATVLNLARVPAETWALRAKIRFAKNQGDLPVAPPRGREAAAQNKESKPARRFAIATISLAAFPRKICSFVVRVVMPFVPRQSVRGQAGSREEEQGQ